jgi:hypothetical protein
MPTPSEVLKLLSSGDKTEAQIKKRLKLSGLQWIKLRSDLLNNWQIATVGQGDRKQYTLLNIARTK